MNSIDNIEVDILVHGKPIRKFSHNGRTFVEARFGEKYSIKIKNNSYERILVVPSADGINVIDGSSASKDGTGYIINGYSSYEIKGFRTSNDKVNLFEFSDKSNSYAAKTEDNSSGEKNCGVIGINIFSEKRAGAWIKTNLYPFYQPWNLKPESYKPNWIGYDDNTWYSNGLDGNNQNSTLTRSFDPGSLHRDQQIISCSVNNFDAGTAFSKQETEDKVVDGSFDKDVNLGCIEIFYATRNSLEKMGVKINKEPELYFPTAFPEQKFCKPPKK